MTWIVHRPNIYDPSKDLPSYVGNCRTVREALIARFGTDQFDLPTYVTVNRIPTLRSDWDNPIATTTTIEVITVPGAANVAILTALTVASLLATAYSLYRISNIPSVATDVGASVPDTSPVFTFAGQKNIQRLNNPVDSVFGKMRWWPAYLCTPRVEYVNNKPVMHLWFSLGEGDFEIEDVRVVDTSVSTVTGASYRQFDSGYEIQSSDDFDLVNYAEEFSNSELLGTNEDDHAVVGPFKLNPTNTVAEKVKINFTFPSGLYGIDGSGNVTSATVNITAYLTEIDNNGNETGASGEFSFVYTKATTSPQRLTETLDPSTKTGWTGTGRYSISAVRTNAKNTGTNGQDRCLIESAYSCGHSGKTFNVSLLHVILPGTSAIDTSAAEKVNLVATRKLQTIVDGVLTTDKYPTRHVVLAILEVLRNSAKIKDSDLDISYWESLIDLLSEYTFDYRFDSKSTVWSALQAMAACARAVPYYVGSDIRLSCDSAIKQPVLMLTADHASDFSLNIDFKTDLENDCIEAAYIDPETGLQDSVFFTPPGSEAKNPTKMTFAGVTDRQTAWRLAAYTYLKRSLLRDRVSITVSQDGKIPLLGEIVLLSMPLPSWTHAGIVESYTPSGASTTLALSDKTPYDAGWLALRRSDGSCYGPVQFTATANTYEVTLQAELSEVFDFTGDTKDFIAYTLSDASVATKRFEVESATPSENTVRLELVEFNPGVFAYDNLSVPDRGDDMEPYPAVTGAVPWLRVLDESGQYLRIEHGPIYGEPTSVVCKYIWIERNNIDYPYMASSPWGFLDDGIVYPMLEADAVGNSHYIERQNKDLYIKFVVKYGSTNFVTWWRGRIGEFGFGECVPLHIWLKNNCNTAYVGPDSSSNRSSPNAQGVSYLAGGGVAGIAVFDVSERKIEVQIDAPPDSSVNVKITCTKQDGSVEKSLTKVSKDGGVVTFTERDMDVAGLLSVGSETTYPVVKLTTWREGSLDKAAECFLDIKPLVTTPIGQTVKITRVSNEFYIPKVEAVVPNSVGQGTYVNFGENYGNISVKCSLLNGFSGISNNSFLASSQQINSSNWSIEKIIATKEGSAVFYRKAYPFFKRDYLSESVFSATLFTVNQSVVDYITIDPYNPPGINYAVYGIAVDKDNKQILPGKILMLLPSTSRISQRPDNYLTTMYPIRVIDNRYETPYNAYYSRELTTSELELFVEELDCVLLIGPGQSRFSTAFDQNPVGIGSVKCSQYDIFGHIGNTTNWGTYALF